MRVISILLMLALIPLALAAINDNGGEYGFQFLQIPANPIAASLAGNGIYGTSYAGAWMQNPAANLVDERFSLSLQHTLWLLDTNYTQIIYSKSNRNRHIGLAARILDSGELDAYNASGELIGNYHPLDANLLVNCAFRIFPDHLLGVNAGLLYEKLDTASSYGLSTDVGYVFLTPVTNAILFSSVKNLGFTSKMDKERIKLPLTVEAGLGYAYPFQESKLSGQIALNKATDTDLRSTISAEFALRQMLKLRAGYKFNYDEEGLTAGIGLNWQNIDIDYGWTSNTDRLNDTHSFGISYNF
jgi:hypothetical protein